MNEEHTKKILFTLDEQFTFSCQKGYACSNTCCRDMNIFLTPYDVLRMRKATGLPSEEFLQKYTVPFLGDDGLPLVLLRVKHEREKLCHFSSQGGCSIYSDRPWSCRMYPVFPVSSEEGEYLIEEKATCLGFKEERRYTIREWKKDQGIDLYDKMNAPYKEITQHDYFANGNKLDIGKTKLVHMACYDLDAFKKFLFNTKFFKIYDVEEETIEKMKENEEELLNFGYQWVKFSLFSEGSIKLKDKEMDKLMKSRNPMSH